MDFEAFEAYLMGKYCLAVAKDRLSYAKKFSDCLVNRDFSELRLMTPDKRVHVMKALAALSKFLGIYEDFRSLVKNYGFKWKGKSSDQLIIERLTKVQNPDEVFEWTKTVKRELPELECFMDFMTVTGLRFIEAINSYNLIIELTKEGKLSSYYDSQKAVLTHYKFKDIFIRNSKKAFISFVSKRLVEAIGRRQPLNYSSVQTIVRRKIRKQRFSDIREAHGTFLTKHLRQPEIDFIHGRVSANVFMQSYFNPALISDLKDRLSKGVSELLNKVS